MKALLIACLLIGLCATAKYNRTVSYEGELVIRCSMQNEQMTSLLNHDLVDVWSVSSDHADIRLHNTLYKQLKDNNAADCYILHDSVEEMVTQFEQTMQKDVSDEDWFKEYHTYKDIVSWYEQLATDNKDVVTYIQSIGKSVERRDQPAVHITAAAKDEDVKIIYFQCQIHAREWISGATCMYMANYLVQNKNDPKVTELLKKVKFVIVPFVNPDGYEYTWINSNNRLWRKNRRPGSSCHGVDLNRNYNDHWNKGGSSNNECSDTYCGPSVDSEPETKNTQNYFRSLANIVGAIDWHSYSQLILRPYGWSQDDCPDEMKLKKLGDKMSELIQSVHGKKYTSQKSIDLYVTTGTASDWFYSDDANRGKYRAAGYTIELRDEGRYGFLLPPAEIIPTGEEVIPAILAFAEELQQNPIEKQ